MTKEQLEALNCAIEHFDRHPARSAAFNLARALERLRDAEAKPAEASADERYWAQVHEPTRDIGPTQRAYDLFFSTTRRLEKERDTLRATCDEWNAWLDKLCGEENCVTEDGQAEIARLVELGREAEAKPVEEPVEPARATRVAMALVRSRAAQAEAGRKIRELQSALLKWCEWADGLYLDAKTADEHRAEIARLAELGRRAEAELGEWSEWAAEVTREPGSRPQEFRDVIGDLVELGRKSEDTEAKLRVCSEQLDAVMNDWGKAAELLRRIVECADEDKFLLQPPTLARAVEEAREVLRPAVPVKEPAAGELETMLEALMGEHCPHPQPWRWCKQQDNYYLYVPKHDGGLVCLGLQGRALRVKYGVHEALAVINARLAELAPKGWWMRLTEEHQLIVGRCVVRSLADNRWLVQADLDARVTEALAWIAEREKPAEPVPEEPITPPSAWEEIATSGGLTWRWKYAGCFDNLMYDASSGSWSVRGTGPSAADVLPLFLRRAEQRFGGGAK